MKKLFEGQSIDVVVEGNKFLFNVEDVAYAVGYAKAASLEHHIKGTKYYIIAKNGKGCTTKAGLDYAAKLATRTPILKRLAIWASKLTYSDMGIVQTKVKITDGQMLHLPAGKEATIKILPPLDMLYGIKEAATKLGMTAKELADWLVDKGYAGRYNSNNAVFWKTWFKNQGYGTKPILIDENSRRESNVSKLTVAGLDFVKNRIASERQASVLAFSQKEATEAEKLEQEINELIVTTFGDVAAPNSSFEIVHTIKTPDLLAKVKGIIAQVKLKEKKT